MPQGKRLRRHRSIDDGNFHSRRQVTGGAKGVGPPQLISASRVIFELLWRDKATASEHLCVNKENINQ